MKKFRRFLSLTCFFSLLLALIAAQAMASDTSDAAIFSPEDMSVGGLALYAIQDEAAALFGTPEKTESFTWDATGDTFETWTYGDLTLTFNAGGEAISAQVYGKQYTGPRGVQVGQTAEDVAGLFYTDPDTSANGVFYSSGYVEELDAQLPPCGYVLRNEDGTFSYNYVAPMMPFGDDVLQDPTNYVYEDLALFQVNFDADGLVTDFSWSIGPWAE